MRINAKEDRRFKATALALNAAKQSVKTSKQHMTALSMGNEPEEQKESASIDPTRFLNHKEIHKWNQLPQSQKRRYIEEGIKASEMKRKSRTGILSRTLDDTEAIEKNVAFRYTTDLYRIEEKTTENSFVNPVTVPQKRFQNRWFLNKKQEKTAVDLEQRSSDGKMNLNTEQEFIQGKRRNHSAEYGTARTEISPGMVTSNLTETAGTNMTTASSTVTSNMAASGTAATGMATSGGSVVVMAGKKAADKFKNYMQERSMASEQAIRNVESKMTEIKTANHEMDSLPASLKYIGAAVGAVLLSVLAVVIQTLK